MQIGDSVVMIADEVPAMGARGPLSLGGTPVMLNIYTENADALFAQALAAGATVKMALSDAFWGDRYGQVADPFGHIWAIATHQRDPTPAEMQKAVSEMFAQAHA
jgi:uncharacterized glyoxalase superfamily protein PhnB